jgi:hypothetical protein
VGEKRVCRLAQVLKRKIPIAIGYWSRAEALAADSAGLKRPPDRALAGAIDDAEFHDLVLHNRKVQRA